MDNSLSVFCLVDGETPACAFRISISFTATVSDLKKLIKTEKTPRFDNVASDELTLWRIFISPTNVDDDEVPVSLDTLTQKMKLRPISRLSKVFTEQPSEEAIHIIVQRPPPVLPITPPSGDLKLDIKRISDRFFAPASDDAGFLDSFVRGLVVLPLTKRSLFGLPSVSFRASHPLPETYPSLLFAGLPESSSNDTPRRHTQKIVLSSRHMKKKRLEFSNTLVVE
ncbi:unnamed protein product [Mortierella alpina]